MSPFVRPFLAFALGMLVNVASSLAILDNGVLARQSRLALYPFETDAAEDTACSDDCVNLWMPSTADEADEAPDAGSSADAADGDSWSSRPDLSP